MAVTAKPRALPLREVARLLYDFAWTEFCDWYVEMAKGRLKQTTGCVPAGARRRARRHLRLVHPIMPFRQRNRSGQASTEVGPGARHPDASKGGRKRLHRPVADVRRRGSTLAPKRALPGCRN